MNRTFLFFTLILTALTSMPLEAEDSSGTRITLAVMNLTVRGNIDEEEGKSVRDVLQAAVKKTAVFEVVERAEIEKVQEELKRGLTGSLDNAGEIGNMLAAQQLLIGSVGPLFDNLVLTVRLVETETGRIILADTVYTDKEHIEQDVKRLAVRLGTKALDSTRDITIATIEKEIEGKRYSRAKRYLDAYLQRHGLSPRVRELRESLLPLLAKQHAKRARTLQRKDKYEEAIESVQEALALRTKEEYILLRDHILEKQREYERQQALKRKKEKQRQEEQKRRQQKIIEEGRFYPVVNYFRELTVHGLHIAPASYWVIGEQLDVPTSLGHPGAELWAVGDPLGIIGTGGRHTLNNVATAGVNVTYINETPYSSVLLTGYLSPYLSGGVKLANISLLFGLDGGGTFWYSNALTKGYRWIINGGATAAVAVKLNRSMGFFVLAKADYQYYKDDPSLSHPAVRLAAGMVF
jgi:tetratricopeptide (TPR) repeat protein